MALQQKVTQEDIDLLMVLEDPIWLGEFLRNTLNGEIDSSLWPKQHFSYRWYQKDFLSDENEFIVLTGGRAIGKCHPSTTRILTVDGYKTIGELYKQPYTSVYSLGYDNTIVQRRAVIVKDARKPTYLLTTASGYKVEATDNHPILTPSGYKLLGLLTKEDKVAVITALPHEQNQQAFQWHELRWLGYTILNPIFRPTTPLQPRYKGQAKEIEYIAQKFITHWNKTVEGAYTLVRKHGPYKHPVEHLHRQCRLLTAADKGLTRIPEALMHESLANVQVFLEALFTQFAALSPTAISIKVPTRKISEGIQELLLRFGVESTIHTHLHHYQLKLRDERAVYRFWNTFHLIGVGIADDLSVPPASNDATPYMRYEYVQSVQRMHDDVQTYAVHVYDTENFIAEHIFVHNSIVLEDKIVYEVVNFDKEFPVTTEETLVTPNQSQMTPILDRLIQRFTSSPLLKSYLENKVNRSKGTLDFTLGARNHRFNARIAGSRGENNMVGLHTPRIRGDEMQLFPMTAFTQLEPTYNSWEDKRQQIHCGVPNGFRNSVLYQLDKRSTRYKKYKIASHNNPYYTFSDDIENVKKYGGEDDDRYQQLVLGRHGSASFQVIPRESIVTEPYDFTNYRYTSADKSKGKSFRDIFTPSPLYHVEDIIFAIDTGYVDPTIIQVLYSDKKGIWRIRARFRIQRIDFSEQEQIIDYLDSIYHPVQISIDIGAGGNGAGILHNLQNRPEYAQKDYAKRMVPILFNETIVAGVDTSGNELVQDSKGYAGSELSRMVQDKTLIFSEIDHEGISQMERLARQKQYSGKDRYFILSEKGSGASEDDHIFASFVCFILGIRVPIITERYVTIGRPRGIFS